MRHRSASRLRALKHTPLACAPDAGIVPVVDPGLPLLGHTGDVTPTSAGSGDSRAPLPSGPECSPALPLAGRTRSVRNWAVCESHLACRVFGVSSGFLTGVRLIAADESFASIAGVPDGKSVTDGAVGGHVGCVWLPGWLVMTGEGMGGGDAETRFAASYGRHRAAVLRRRVRSVDAEDLVAQVSVVSWRRVEDLPAPRLTGSGCSVSPTGWWPQNQVPGHRAQERSAPPGSPPVDPSRRTTRQVGAAPACSACPTSATHKETCARLARQKSRPVHLRPSRPRRGPRVEFVTSLGHDLQDGSCRSNGQSTF